MVLTRAFAYATLVVASDIDAYRAVVTAATGTLVPPGDPDALAEAVTAMFADEPARARCGAAARELAAARYAWPRLARELAAHYRSMLACSSDE